MGKVLHADALVLADWLEGSAGWPSHVPQDAAIKLRQLRLALEQTTSAHLKVYEMLTHGWDREKVLKTRIAQVEAENASLRAQRQPMTDDDAHDIATEFSFLAPLRNFIDTVRAAERHHGIGGGNED